MAKREKPADRKLLLSTGSTLLNLACSGRTDGGFRIGTYNFFVGDSNSGKTFIGLTCLAEAANDPRFDGYRLIHDDVEGGALMNLRRFFGSRMADRIEPPAGSKAEPVYSRTAEEFYYHVDDALKDGRPFIFVEDSQDGLSSGAEEEKFDEKKAAHRKGKDATGSYGDAKAKIHSANIRKLLGPLKDTGSILLVLNQTRDSFSIFEKSTYSGGRALKFYAALQLWASVKGQITRQIKGKKRQLGVNCKVQVRKNRITGRDRTVVVPIYHSYGIDDTGSMVSWLVEEGRWTKSKSGVVEATGLGPTFSGRLDQVVARIEERGMEDDLRTLVGMIWNDVEKACRVKRKRRYE